MTSRREVALAGHLGDEETARLGLTDSRPEVRATALGALARLGHLTAAEISSGLIDTAPQVRARAAELAIPFASTKPELLTGALSDPSPMVVEAACFAFGETSELSDPNSGATGPSAAPSVISGLTSVALEHPDALCREAAVAALGALGDPAGTPAILAATGDKPAVRRRAVLALAAFSGPEVDTALEKALEDRDWQVRQAAEDMTGRRGREPGPGQPRTTS